MTTCFITIISRKHSCIATIVTQYIIADKSASTSTMDAIRKKMQSLKAETDGELVTLLS